MKKSVLSEQTMKKLPANWDVEHYLTILFSFPQNKWFAPTNKNGSNEFTVCSQLAECNLIASKKLPIYKNGSFTGCQIYFYYNLDLEYNI